MYLQIFYISFFVFILSIFFTLLRKPRQKRDWVPEHSELAHTQISGEIVTLKNIVSANYSYKNTCEVTYYDKTFGIHEVESCWFIIEYFPIHIGPLSFDVAHSFLTFGFKDGDFISISVAGRRKIGEDVTFARILPHKNEIVYKVINEADTLYARAYHNKDEVCLYKLNADEKTAQKILLSMLEDTNKLTRKPAWFDTFTRNCTSEIMRHLRNTGLKVPLWHPTYIFTTGIDKLLHKLGLIESDLPFEETQNRHNITKKIQELGKHPRLSKKIREF